MLSLTCSALVMGTLLIAAPPATESTAASAQDLALKALAQQVEQARIQHHVPGCAVAVVHKGEVIFAQGFGMADLEEQRPATADTRFFIGSTTKAFTATLIGMLVDDGLMDWDDPVEKHLPYFTLEVDSTPSGAKATIRDTLCHRTGFPRMGHLWASGAMTSEQILRRAATAEPFAPFRSKFYYNNVMFLAAGWASAAAADQDWGALLQERILNPLEMNDTVASIRIGRQGPKVARSYSWNEDLERHVLHSPSPEAASVDPVAPAGSIGSSAHDMAKWIRFLLAGGENDGQQLISEASLNETWTRQLEVGGGKHYGLGWILHQWQGQKLIEHGGAVPGGFSTEVALLPEADLGFVVLSNAFPTALPNAILSMVPRILLGEPGSEVSTSTSGSSENFAPLLGRYVANFATRRDEIFTVAEKDGHLTLDIPSAMVFDLEPLNQDGVRPFTLSNQTAVSFVYDDQGQAVELKMHEGGMEFHLPREGLEFEPVVDLDELQGYLGSYRSAAQSLDLNLMILNQRMAFEVGGSLFDLHPPDDEDRWLSRANPDLWIGFDQDDQDVVIGLSLHRPGNSPTLHFTRSDDRRPDLPTVAELVELRRAAIQDPGATPIRNRRRTGSIRYPHSAVEGTYEVTTAGPDRMLISIDLGELGEFHMALNGGNAWRDSTWEMEPFEELTGKMREQIRQANPVAIQGDWRDHYDSVKVLQEERVKGRKVYVVELASDGLPALKIGVDAETGDVLVSEQNVMVRGLGSMKVSTRWSDYREVHGVRIPFRTTESNQHSGRTTYVLEDFEVNLELDHSRFDARK